jgi:hypothetical protein
MPRTDLVTASRAELAVILLPLVGTQQAARMLARNLVPVGVAVQVLVDPARRRAAEAPVAAR